MQNCNEMQRKTYPFLENTFTNKQKLDYALN